MWKTMLSRLLRWKIKALAYCCYLLNKPERSYLAPSGKVLDHREIFNMIDASLDMWLTTGRFNESFEEKLATTLGVKYALTVNSGSSANLLAVSALTSHRLKERALKPGDEVITVAAGFPTTINPVIQNGLVPVFVDTDPGTYNIKVEEVEGALSEKTRAIFVAHTLGNPFNLEKIKEICEVRDLWLIEDNCDALGARYKDQYTGAFGHIATLSFYPAHHITMGEGGAVLTNQRDLSKILASFRDWGRDCWCPPGNDNTCGARFGQRLGNLPRGYDHKYTYSQIGYNLKITDWQAAIGLAQLEKLESFVEKRRENFEILYRGLSSLEEYFILPRKEEEADPSWFGFTLTVKDNDQFDKQKLVQHLEERNIGTRNLFAGNVLRQPYFLNYPISIRVGDSELLNSQELTEEHYQRLPGTEKMMTSSFWIGLWPGLTREHMDYMVSTIQEFVRASCSYSGNESDAS
ncbi:MAG: lipopolysaccharide biosynthesis protein RfbH [Planctomycetota bacterium]|jgi:CDP-6-deoxy-D-xylo-4-hexulose-3-dehydrase